LWFAGLLGAAVLAGSPIVAQADQGKWWDPQGRGPSRERRVERQVRTNQGDRRVNRSWQQGRSRPRFQRSFVTIRDGRRGTGYRARRVWASPYYIQRQHLVVVRPVRYFVGAGASIGGLHIDARFHDHDRYLYGCNFCDARFSGYNAYHAHVLHCDARPAGYRLDVSDWNDEWNNEACDVEGCEIHGGGHHADAGYDDRDDNRYDDRDNDRNDYHDDGRSDNHDDGRYNDRDDDGYDR
jgi:hypothetical protein